MKKTTILLIGILLVGSVIAGVASNRDRTIRLSREQKQALESTNLGDYGTELNQIGNEYELCLRKQECHNQTKRECYDEYQLNCSDITTLTCKQVIDKCSPLFKTKKQADDWEVEFMKKLANITIQRQSIPEKVKIEEGVTKIK